MSLGETYVCGLIRSGLTGAEIGQKDGSVSLPVRIRLPKSAPVAGMESSGGHIAAVSADGDIYTVGLGSHSRTGQGSEVNSERFTKIVPEVRSRVRFLRVQTGGWHGLALASSGDVYQWGYSLSTKGDSRQPDLKSPVLVPPAKSATARDTAAPGAARGGGSGSRGRHNAVSITCGSYCSGYVTADGALFTWGSGPLGIPSSSCKGRGRRALPHKMTAGVPTQVIVKPHPSYKNLSGEGPPETSGDSLAVQQASLSELHGGAVTRCGRVWMWGSNASGCLGMGDAAGKKLPTGSFGHMLNAPLAPAESTAEAEGGSSEEGKDRSAAALARGAASGAGADLGSLRPALMGRERSLSENDGDPKGGGSGKPATGHTAEHGIPEGEALALEVGLADEHAKRETMHDRPTSAGPSDGQSRRRSLRGGGSDGSSPDAAGGGGSADPGEPAAGGGGGTGTMARPVFMQVSCSSGTHHPSTLAVDIAGRLWGWGSNYKAKLGGGGYWKHGDRDAYPKPTLFPQEWFSGAKIRQAVSGGIHNACLTEDGVVYSWGCGSDGRMGHPDASNFRYLYRETLPRPLEWVCDSASHSPGGSVSSKSHTAVSVSRTHGPKGKAGHGGLAGGGGEGTSRKEKAPLGWTRVFQPAIGIKRREVLHQCTHLMSSYRNMIMAFQAREDAAT